MKGKPDPHNPGCMLVHSDPSFRPIFRAPEGTVYRWDRKTRSVVGLVTVMPDGLHMAWDSCGGCAQHVRGCVCKYGIVAPRSVDVIYTKTIAVMDGQRWEDVEVARRSYTVPRIPTKGPKVRHIQRRTNEAPRRHIISDKPVAPAKPKPRRIVSKTNGTKVENTGVDLRHIDMTAMDALAERTGEEITDRFVRHLTGTKTEPVKRKLTRRHLK